MSNSSSTSTSQTSTTQKAPNISNIGKEFIKHYYSLFGSDRSKLAGLYQSSSKLTFEGTECIGQQAIVAKFTSINAKKMAFTVKTIDCQPSGCNGIIVMCTGDLKIDDEKNAVKFAQVFHLVPTEPNSTNFWVHNDVFRMNYG